MQTKKCNNTKDNIPLKIYREYASVLCKPLIVLFTSIFTYNIIPECLKTADCIPLYKGKGKKTQASSYRAIFNLTFLTKVFEKIIYHRLNKMVEPSLCDAQHGFRKRRSCETAVSCLTQSIFNTVDKRKGKVLAIFIDFRKAFDSVNRNLLLEKMMNEFNVEPYMVKLFRNYFTDRKFKIINGNFNSKYYEINNGVPPGSCLGSILFSMFINSISKVIDLPHYLYADDLVIFVDATDLKDGFSKLQNCLAKVEKWCDKNSLTINVDKTKAMFFYKAHDRISKSEIKNCNQMLMINKLPVEFVENFKYLGIWLDSNLDFKRHMLTVENKLTGAIKKMHIYKRLLSEKVIKAFLSAFVLNIVDYGLCIWYDFYNCINTNIQKR